MKMKADVDISIPHFRQEMRGIIGTAEIAALTTFARNEGSADRHIEDPSVFSRKYGISFHRVISNLPSSHWRN
ncbi:MAG: hypothetical protein JSV53_09760 [candidate division WOR-3 bacterium]|nr:MAG: hypothetical protein JSV53_09760 [candidate division WOR-3 bacterium]